MRLPPNLVRVGLTIFRVDSDFRVLERVGMFTIDGYDTPPPDAVTQLSSLVGPLAYGVPLDPLKLIEAAQGVMERTRSDPFVQYRDSLREAAAVVTAPSPGVPDSDEPSASRQGSVIS